MALQEWVLRACQGPHEKQQASHNLDRGAVLGKSGVLLCIGLPRTTTPSTARKELHAHRRCSTHNVATVVGAQTRVLGERRR